MLLLLFLIILYSSNSIAGNRFNSGYSCSDARRECIDSGTKVVDGIEVYRDCWEWGYSKTCNVPSKDDCRLYGHCYSFGQKDCLLRDNYGNCINALKEFSCERWVPAHTESELAKKRYSEKEAAEELVCRGIPCLDGNCVDKSYQMDEEMLSSVSKLYALAQGKVKDNEVSLFEGSNMHCSNKMLGASKCCNISPKGWMHDFGAKCTNGEKLLARKRADNLCVFALETKSSTAGVVTVRKRHYCCFNNIIEKVFQEQVRKQLGIGFAKGGNTDCRGLTLEELFDPRVDFSKMDFSEVAADIAKKMQLPEIGDVESRVISSIDNIHIFNEEIPDHEDNKFAGINRSLTGPTEEEIRLEEERLARLEEERLEAERLEQERVAREEEERRIRLAKEQRRGQLNTLKRKKELELAETERLLEKERAYHELHYASSHAGNAPNLQYIAAQKCKLSLVRQKFLKGTKTRLEKEIREIESEFGNILLPGQLNSKKEAKESELRFVQSELEKAKAERSHYALWNTGYPLFESKERVQHYQKEEKRLEKELTDGAY